MRRFSIGLVAVMAILSASSANATIVLGIANASGGFINFKANDAGDGATVSFISSSASDPSFNVTHVNGASSTGMSGTINGSFTYSSTGLSGVYQSTSLAGVGQLVINSGIPGDDLIANITGIEIYSVGLTGAINTGGAINIDSVVYGGSNATLIQFMQEVNSGSGVGTLSYAFDKEQAPASLKDLASVGSDKSTTFNGTLAANAVPEPGTFGMAISGVALVGLGYLRRRRLVQA